MKIKLHNIQSTISLAPLSNKDLTLGLKGEYLWRENILSFLPGYIPSVSANNSLKRSSSRAQGRMLSILTSLDFICGILPVAHFNILREKLKFIY